MPLSSVHRRALRPAQSRSSPQLKRAGWSCCCTLMAPLALRTLPSLEAGVAPAQPGGDCAAIAVLPASDPGGVRLAACTAGARLRVYRWRQATFAPMCEAALAEPVRWMAWASAASLWLGQRHRYSRLAIPTLEQRELLPATTGAQAAPVGCALDVGTGAEMLLLTQETLGVFVAEDGTPSRAFSPTFAAAPRARRRGRSVRPGARRARRRAPPSSRHSGHAPPTAAALRRHRSRRLAQPHRRRAGATTGVRARARPPRAAHRCAAPRARDGPRLALLGAARVVARARRGFARSPPSCPPREALQLLARLAQAEPAEEAARLGDGARDVVAYAASLGASTATSPSAQRHGSCSVTHVL